MLLDPCWNVNIKRTKYFRKSLDYICWNLPPDSETPETDDGTTIPCTARRENGHKKLVLALIETLSTESIRAWVESFLNEFPSNVPEYEFDDID